MLIKTTILALSFGALFSCNSEIEVETVSKERKEKKSPSYNLKIELGLGIAGSEGLVVSESSDLQ